MVNRPQAVATFSEIGPTSTTVTIPQDRESEATVRWSWDPGYSDTHFKPILSVKGVVKSKERGTTRNESPGFLMDDAPTSAPTLASSLPEPRSLGTPNTSWNQIKGTSNVLFGPCACCRTVIACGPGSRPKAAPWVHGKSKSDLDGRRDNGRPARRTVPDRTVRRFFHEPRRGESVVQGGVVLREREERGDIGMGPKLSSRMAAPNSGGIRESAAAPAEHPRQTPVTSCRLRRWEFLRLPSSHCSRACSAGPMPLRHLVNPREARASLGARRGEADHVSQTSPPRQRPLVAASCPGWCQLQSVAPICRESSPTARRRRCPSCEKHVRPGAGVH